MPFVPVPGRRPQKAFHTVACWITFQRMGRRLAGTTVSSGYLQHEKVVKVQVGDV